MTARPLNSRPIRFEQNRIEAKFAELSASLSKGVAQTDTLRQKTPAELMSHLEELRVRYASSPVGKEER